MVDKMVVLAALAVVLLTFIPTVESLDCYTCSNVTHLAKCNTLTVCQSGEACHSEFTTIGGVRRYTLGCKSSSLCPLEPTVGSGSSSLVGRSVISTQDIHCSECCESGLCNRQLCQNYDPTCVDTTDCSVIGSISNICVDVGHIKTICKRFCGLCSLVDGGWSHWSSWTACDRTCENGTMTRTHLCNNPTPENGGATCVGSQQETESCNANMKCPVHGGWSHWSSWGTCSATCDIGMQRRDRSCSQPYPTNGGDSCYGDGRDDRLCLPGACADGGWSSWRSWGSCSRSCDGGLQTRSRQCDHPAPSVMGKSCVGDSTQSEICNMSPCQDGGWSSWRSWGSCSRSCDGGLQTRSRQCDHPAPSVMGKSCVGDSTQSEICNMSPCQGKPNNETSSLDVDDFVAGDVTFASVSSVHWSFAVQFGLENDTDYVIFLVLAVGPVVFYAKDLNNYQPSMGADLIYRHVPTNLGNAYNNRTGIFTAPVYGTYSFSVQFCAFAGHGTQVGLFINDFKYQSSAADNDYYSCRSFSVTAYLRQGDKVNVKTGNMFNTNDGQVFGADEVNRVNSFSGALVMRL